MAKDRPDWVKFDLDDYCGDQNVKLCPLETQGWYMHLLHVLSRAENYGYLVINGQEHTPELLHTLTGYPARVCKKHLEILKINEVLKHDEKGWYNERLVKDWLEFRQNQDNGLRGAEAKKNKGLEAPPKSPPLKLPLEAIEENKNKKKNTHGQSPDFEKEFTEILWPEIWDKVTRADSLRLVVALRKKGISLDTLLAGVREYKREKQGTDLQFYMQPKKFFGRGEHWKEYAEKASERKKKIAAHEQELTTHEPEKKPPPTPEELARAKELAEKIKRGAGQIADARELDLNIKIKEQKGE